MSMRGRERLLLADACILIDFTTLCPNILTVLARHYGSLHVPSPVLAEVEGLDDDACATLGIFVVEPSSQQLAEAAGGGGALSFEDRLCLAISRDGNMTCITNDGALRRECERQGVPTMRGLRCLLELVREELIRADEAEEAAEAMHVSDPLRVTEVLLEAFRRELRASSTAH